MEKSLPGSVHLIKKTTDTGWPKEMGWREKENKGEIWILYRQRGTFCISAFSNYFPFNFAQELQFSCGEFCLFNVLLVLFFLACTNWLEEYVAN